MVLHLEGNDEREHEYYGPRPGAGAQDPAARRGRARVLLVRQQVSAPHSNVEQAAVLRQGLAGASLGVQAAKTMGCA